MDQDKVPLITDRYHKWLQKQLQGKGSEVRLLMRRTMNTAIAVRCGVEKISFEELTKNLFFFCSDLRTKEFTRLYEAQIELASINEEKFIKGLHKFYNETAIRIKKENLYQEFFEFISLSMRVRGERILANGARDDEKFAVIDAFQSLLMQQLEYLRPNKFDFSVVLCGQTTDGELMTVKDTLPDFDVPGYEIQDAPYSGKKISSHAEMEEFICATYRRHGFQVHTFEDVEALFNEDKIYTNHHCSLCPYINEYTYDILPDPDHPLSTAIISLLAFRDEKIDGEELIEKLRHRARTLPTNGVEFRLESKEARDVKDLTKCDILSSVLLKELLYDDTVIMLYKVCTYLGDISGYYDTKDGMFYSVLIDAPSFDLYTTSETLSCISTPAWFAETAQKCSRGQRRTAFSTTPPRNRPSRKCLSTLPRSARAASCSICITQNATNQYPLQPESVPETTNTARKKRRFRALSAVSAQGSPRHRKQLPERRRSDTSSPRTRHTCSRSSEEC